jgi:hypothetical protein
MGCGLAAGFFKLQTATTPTTTTIRPAITDSQVNMYILLLAVKNIKATGKHAQHVALCGKCFMLLDILSLDSAPAHKLVQIC